jgi:Xaa-Pro dipeptidase
MAVLESVATVHSRWAVGCSKIGRGAFAEIHAQSLIRPWGQESEINESVYALARSMYGVSRYWHERIVRAGRNTLAPYDENPPDLTVGEDGIVFLDFGPVFEEGKPTSGGPTS